MGISKDDVWIAEVVEGGRGEVVWVGSRDSAPAEFASVSEIESYVQGEFDVGEYDILDVEGRVVVDRVDEMYSEYDADDLAVIDEVCSAFRSRDERRVVSVVRMDDPDGQVVKMNHSGVSLNLSPYACDLVVEVRKRDGESVAAVCDWVGECAEGLRVVGYTRAAHYERRGDRGEPTVRVALKRDVGAVRALVESVMQDDRVEFCAPVDSMAFVSRASPVSVSAEQVIAMELGLEVETSALGDDPSPGDVLAVVDSELTGFIGRVESETPWVVSDFGFVAASEGSFYRVAIGVASGR